MRASTGAQRKLMRLASREAWERWEWLKTLAIPEHALGWTLMVCPIAALIVACVGSKF